MKPLAQKHPVRAKVNVFLSIQKFTDQRAEFGIDHGLAAADRDNRGTAFIGCIEALLNAEFFFNRVGVFPDAPATRTRQVTGVQRFEHHHEWEFVYTAQSFTRDVLRHACSHT